MNETFIVAMRRVGLALRRRQFRRATRAVQDAFLPGRSHMPAAGRASFGFAEDRSDWIDDGRDLPPDPPKPKRSPDETGRSLRDGSGAPEPEMRQTRADSQAQDFPTTFTEAAGFHDRMFACEAGMRSYRLFVPSLAGRPAQGLVVMLHGCTQTPEEFAATTGMNALAEEFGVVVAYPQQTGEHSPMQCWNWYRPSDQQRGSGEPAILAGLAVALRDAFDLPQARVFAAGLSAGGAMAAILAEAYPDLFEAVGIHSGIAPGTARDALSAFAAMRGDFYNGVKWHLQATTPRAPRVIIFHGDADRTVHPSNARRIAGAAQALFPAGVAETCEGRASGGRSFRRQTQFSADGLPMVEAWCLEGLGHAWSGGAAGAPYSDADGPDASREMLRFFLGKRSTL